MTEDNEGCQQDNLLDLHKWLDSQLDNLSTKEMTNMDNIV